VDWVEVSGFVLREPVLDMAVEVVKVVVVAVQWEDC
jgi:hypothetical protein